MIVIPEPLVAKFCNSPIVENRYCANPPINSTGEFKRSCNTHTTTNDRRRPWEGLLPPTTHDNSPKQKRYDQHRTLIKTATQGGETSIQAVDGSEDQTRIRTDFATFTIRNALTYDSGTLTANGTKSIADQLHCSTSFRPYRGRSMDTDPWLGGGLEPRKFISIFTLLIG